MTNDLFVDFNNIHYNIIFVRDGLKTKVVGTSIHYARILSEQKK